MLLANLWMGSAEGGPNPSGMMFTMFGFLAIFYFLFLRPQSKQRKEHESLIQGVKKGDEIVTLGGIIGTIVHVAEDRVTIKSGETRLEIERSKIGGVISS